MALWVFYGFVNLFLLNLVWLGLFHPDVILRRTGFLRARPDRDRFRPAVRASGLLLLAALIAANWLFVSHLPELPATPAQQEWGTSPGN